MTGDAASFDPELYLRLVGEGLVVAAGHGDGVWHNHCLLEAATALVAFGVIDAERAQRVLVDYAAALRPFVNPGARTFRLIGPLAPEPEQLSPRRAFAADAEVQSTQGRGRARVRWLTLGASRLTLGLSAIRGSDATMPPTPAAPAVGVRIPDGRETQAVFAGGWSRGDIEGIFSAPITIGIDTPWLTIEGMRVELNRPSPPPHVWVEELDPQVSAIAYVWQLMADFTDSRPEATIGAPALGALRAAGLISDDDAAIEAIAWVRERLATDAPPGGTEGSPPTPTAAPAGVPAGWRKLIERQTGAFEGAPRTVPVGAVTPVFDGVCLAIDTLLSGPSGLWLECEITGARLRSSDAALLSHTPLTLWARDDRDNVYLGHVGRWSGDPETRIPRRVSIQFASLDPAATELLVTAATMRAQSMIRIAL